MNKIICLYLSIKWKPKGSMTLLAVESSYHASTEVALGHIYNFKGLSYLKKYKDFTIVWGGNPSYGYSNYDFCIICKSPAYCNISVNLKNHSWKVRVKGWLQEMFDDWFKNPHPNRKSFEDNSIQMSIMSWKTTIPKGYKLVRPGTIILKTDKEFDDGSRPKFWGTPNWYNIGKKVKKRQGCSWVDAKGRTYRSVPGYIDPLIIRKINKA